MTVPNDSPTAPRLNPRLTPRQLWTMANEPGWRPWIDLIAGHPHAWPELREWADQATLYGFDAVGAAPEPPADANAGPRLLRSILEPSTPSPPELSVAGAAADMSPIPTDTAEPEPGTDGTEPETGEPAGPPEPWPEEGRKPADDDPMAGLAAVAEDEGERPAKKGMAIDPRMPIAIACCILAVLLVAAGASFAVERHRAAVAAEERETAVNDCAKAAKTLKTSRAAWEKLLKDTKTGAGKLQANQVKDAKTVDALKKAMAAATPTGSASCTAGGRGQVENAARSIRKAAGAYDANRKALQKAAKAVEASKLDKTVADAMKLLAGTKGKVQDDRTRQTLDKAIKARDEQAIAKAVKAVTDSKAAKDKADAEAKAKKEAEKAAARAAQQQQAAASNSGSSSGSGRANSGYSGSSGYSSGSYGSGYSSSTPRSSGAGGSSSSGSGSTSSGQQGGGAPSWSVSSEPSEDNLPGHDPGI